MLAAAGFAGTARDAEPHIGRHSWIDLPAAGDARAALTRIDDGVAKASESLTEAKARMADYAVVTEAGYPRYLGGPSAWRERERVRRT